MSVEPPGITHHTAHLNGIRQHWVSAGHGEPVYLLHGFPETWFAWRKQIPALAQQYTVIAPDLRGYGATDKPAAGYDKRTMANDVIALMDHLGHRKITLVGHDRGARVATRFAKDHADRLERLVVLDNIPTLAIAKNFDLAVARIGWFFIFLGIADLPETLIQGKEREFLTHFYRTWSYNPELFSEEELEVYVKNYQQPGAVRGSCADYRAIREDVAQDMVDAGQKISVPTLSLWGANFEAASVMDMDKIWRDMATDVRTVAIDQCGHLTQEEQPEIVTKELLAFFASGTRA